MPDDRAGRITCVECGHLPFPQEEVEESWRVNSDGLGELHVFCPECAEREFGE
jgi:ribosomal protein S27AE